MEEVEPVLLEIDKLIRLSRVREMEFITNTDAKARIRGITAALRRLPRGEYLLGTGPSTVGIIPLASEEVVLGRLPTVVEKPAEAMVDYCATDTLYFVPREVSRVHASVLQRMTRTGVQHVVTDLHSSCGTFVNGEPVDPHGDGIVLKHGDVISLGPSQTSIYVYYQNRVPLDLRRDRDGLSGARVPEACD